MIAVYVVGEFVRESSCISHKEPRKRERAFIHIIVNLYPRKEFLHLIHGRPFNWQHFPKLVRFHDKCHREFPLEGGHENLVIVFDDKHSFHCCRAYGGYLVKLFYRNWSEGHYCVTVTFYQAARNPSIFHNDLIVVWAQEEFICIPPLVIVPLI